MSQDEDRPVRRPVRQSAPNRGTLPQPPLPAHNPNDPPPIPPRDFAIRREQFPLPLPPGTPVIPPPRPPPSRRAHKVKFYEESKKSDHDGLVQEIKYGLEPHPLRDLSKFIMSMRDIVNEHLLSILHAGKGVGFWVTIQVISNPHEGNDGNDPSHPQHSQNYPSQ